MIKLTMRTNAYAYHMPQIAASTSQLMETNTGIYHYHHHHYHHVGLCCNEMNTLKDKCFDRTGVPSELSSVDSSMSCSLLVIFLHLLHIA